MGEETLASLCFSSHLIILCLFYFDLSNICLCSRCCVGPWRGVRIRSQEDRKGGTWARWGCRHHHQGISFRDRKEAYKNVHGPTLPLKQEEQWVTWLVWVPTGEGWTLFDSMTTSKRSSSWNVFVWYRELGLKKVEKCLQTRLSTRAEHSGKRDVQLRILFVPMGKEHCLHTRMFLWFLKRNRPWDKTDSKLIRKFPKTKS